MHWVGYFWDCYLAMVASLGFDLLIIYSPAPVAGYLVGPEKLLGWVCRLRSAEPGAVIVNARALDLF